jgi:hypothetical protein
MRRTRAVVGLVAVIAIAGGAAWMAFREMKSRRMPVLKQDEAVAAARRDLGFTEGGEAELVVLGDDTVPFLREKLRGRRAWSVRFGAPLPKPLDAWKDATLEAVIEPDTGLVLIVRVLRPGVEVPLTVEQEEQDLERSSQRSWRASAPAQTSFFAALRNVDAMLPVTPARGLRAYLLEYASASGPPVWTVDVLGLPVDPASQLRGPPPGAIIPASNLCCEQVFVDGVSGALLGSRNLPH